MEFRILGPLEVWDEDREVSLGGPKPRALLAVLLLHPNEVLPAERLDPRALGRRTCPTMPPPRCGSTSRVFARHFRKTC